VFSRDGSVLAVTRSTDVAVILWDEAVVLDPTTGEELFRRPPLRGEGGDLNLAGGAALTPDGGLVAFADISGVRVWSTAGEPRYTVPLHGRATDFTFSPDGRLLATASDLGEVVLSRAADGERVGVVATAVPEDVRSHTSASVRTLAFSPNGLLLAVGSENGDVDIWELANGHQVASIRGTPMATDQLSFSPDSSRLAVPSNDGSITLYVVNLEEQIELARQRLVRGFTDGECRQYLHLETCPAS
jgi:WD40 repeat protein